MSVITAYRCDQTGKLFDNKEKYQKHLRKLAMIRRNQRKIEAAHRTSQRWWADNFWNNVRSIAQLQAAIMHHVDVFAANGVKNYWSTPKLQPTPIVCFNEFRLRYADCVSNSHNAPHNGETNWGGYKENVPRGYPGWEGRMSYIVESFPKQLGSYPGGSDSWKNTRIHTGSGGGGGCPKDMPNAQSFGYDFRIFADDWPALKDARERAFVWKQLNGDKRTIDEILNSLYPAEDYQPKE